MENKLDDVEEGKLSWIEMMTEFYKQFVPWVTAAKERPQMPEDISEKLLSCFENVTFDPAKKIGKRSYDDKRFFNSVKGQFDKEHTISDRQFQALLGMAKRYNAQLDTEKLAQLPEEYRLELTAASEESVETPAADPVLNAIFAALEKVEFAPPPETKKKRTFDDRTFYESLRQQHETGKALSEKQLTVFKRMVEKYAAQLKEVAAVEEFLGFKPGESLQEGENPVDPAAESGCAESLLQELGKVTVWGAPVKRGRYTYDDKKFYTSVKKQFDEGRTLSSKQLAALEKLAERYRNKEQ